METGEDAVRRAVNGFAEAWNRHDMDGLGALFTPDADFVNVTGRWWKGRQGIQTSHAFTHATISQSSPGVDVPAHAYGIFKVSNFHFDRIDVRLIRPDVAIAHGAWTMVGDSRTTESRSGTMTFVVTRDRDRWLIRAAQNTEINRTVKT
ncbi:MAG TPA: SgcJ/EcaC family oxidoreductase [bacterium]|nr:SgcJ/EcaC family oxidoreductase [bacterium]